MAAPTSCLLLILAANQSAALSDASLPYLVQGAPEALRFASAKSIAPRPARPVASLKPPATDPPAAAPVSTSPPGDTANPSATSPPSATPGDDVKADGTAPGSTPNPNPSGTSPPNPNAETPPQGIELIPDTYSPRTSVRVEDLLPFFAPPGQPVSRATYELK